MIADLSTWFAGLEGTADGARVAALLALISAMAHAVFGALQKGRHDPWLTRGAIDTWLAVISAPIALFLVPWPDKHVAILLVGVFFIHFIYKLTMALAYERAAYTVVYPIVRGTGPAITVIAASLVFSESFTALQWFGILCLSGGILFIAVLNLRQETLDASAVRLGIMWALMGGLMVAVYTTFGAYSIRQSPDPFTFLAWFFFITALDFPFIAWWRYRRMENRPALGALNLRGFAGAVIAWFSFGGVMLATRISDVGEAAVLRETSTVFAALIGWLILREKVGPVRILMMVLVALGAIIVEMGG